MATLDTGSLSLTFPDGTLTASGDQLSIVAGADAFDATDYPLLHCALCQPGQTIDFSGSWLGSAGQVTAGNEKFSTGGALDPVDTFSVDTPSTLMPALGSAFSLNLPFTLSYAAADVQATGLGTVHVDFVPRDQGWFSQSAVYTLDPPTTAQAVTPEPSSVLLMLTALVLGLFRRQTHVRSNT